MNILQVSQNYFVAGGSDSYFFSLSSLLGEQSHSVIPFTAKSDKDMPTKWAAHFPSSFKQQPNRLAGLFEYLYSPKSRRAMGGLLRQERFDIAHLHIYYGTLTASILEPLKRANIPIVQTLHEYKLVCPVYTLEHQGQPCNKCVTGTPLNAIVKRCKNGSLIDSTIRVAENLISRKLGDIRLVDRFISVSDFHRRKMIEGGVPEHKLATIHNFVDTDAIQESEQDSGYALYFGRIEKLKGIGTLLRAFKNVPFRLVIAGEGNSLDHFKQMAAELDLCNVEFVGFKSGDSLTRLIREARFCVVPSEWYENCPMSVLEAMAHGKPVVASDIGGIPELIRNGVDGYLFEPKSVEQLAEHCTRLADRKNARALGHNARRNAVDNFSKAAHYQKIMDVYRSVSLPA